VPHLGGGFGSKTYAKLEPLAAALARAAGRPVRLAASVAEAFQTVRRCAARVHVRVGFRRDGLLVAVECDADYDVGAYADIGPRVVQKATYTATGPYRVPHVELAARAVYTNTTPGGAFRGFGVPQLAWALESLVDAAADRLGRHPVELRRQNFLAHGEEFAPRDTPIDGKLDDSLSPAAAALGAATRDLTRDAGAVVAAARGLPYAEVLLLRFGMSGGELIGRGVIAPGRTAAPLGGSTPFWEMAVGAAEVSVDEETGAVRVERYVSVADVGRAINPLTLEGQDEGGVVQGLGHTLLEEMLYADGHLLNGTLLVYRVPRADDVPA